MVVKGEVREVGVGAGRGELIPRPLTALVKPGTKGKSILLSKGQGVLRSLDVQRCRIYELFLTVIRGKINNNCQAMPKKNRNARNDGKKMKFNGKGQRGSKK